MGGNAGMLKLLGEDIAPGALWTSLELPLFSCTPRLLGLSLL